jgi:hypothetical protein
MSIDEATDEIYRYLVPEARYSGKDVMSIHKAQSIKKGIALFLSLQRYRYANSRIRRFNTMIELRINPDILLKLKVSMFIGANNWQK